MGGGLKEAASHSPSTTSLVQAILIGSASNLTRFAQLFGSGHRPLSGSFSPIRCISTRISDVPPCSVVMSTGAALIAIEASRLARTAMVEIGPPFRLQESACHQHRAL